jgi:hypothetical protein
MGVAGQDGLDRQAAARAAAETCGACIQCGFLLLWDGGLHQGLQYIIIAPGLHMGVAGQDSSVM